SGEEVEITITFTSPIILPAGHYFFRPEVLLTSGGFLYFSGPRPILPPAGRPFPARVADPQAWSPHSNFAPGLLRGGTDVTRGTTINMAFSLTAEIVPETGTPGLPNCHGQTISALAHQFGSIDAAASPLGFSTVQALQNTFGLFCE